MATHHCRKNCNTVKKGEKERGRRRRRRRMNGSGGTDVERKKEGEELGQASDPPYPAMGGEPLRHWGNVGRSVCLDFIKVAPVHVAHMLGVIICLFQIERKLELQHAIMKMEEGGSADGILQVRADRIQSDLEELLKALMEFSKQHNVAMKSSAIIELPHGWEPGIAEISAVWDEDWDKFEDEGVTFDIAVPANTKSTLHPIPINDGTKSPPGGSPEFQRPFQSISEDLSDDHIRKSFEKDAETNRSFEESALDNFGNHDDVDPVWGFSEKDSDHDNHGENYFFGSGGFGESPLRSESPAVGKNSLFTFEDSVPGSPLSRAGNSPRYSVGSGDPFETFSRTDSFSTHHDHSSSPRRGTLTRFDSINSSVGNDRNPGFSYDDSDPFGSSSAFKVSTASQTPKKSSENWNAF
ncbi:hypothetical protein DM860_007245 [Cuscuta australis]|uniref:Uncharacterized protein n=1 Tax=Cuscuta australis TaxID=267555 RepID=A0A328E6W2_9ASTE|nr:hypothetical protein DM860_007245 [Cuscuta australis]